jgi:hypothetical protein
MCSGLMLRRHAAKVGLWPSTARKSRHMARRSAEEKRRQQQRPSKAGWENQRKLLTEITEKITVELNGRKTTGNKAEFKAKLILK